MDTEMINEFYLLQTSRSNQKYNELLDDHVYAPIVKANGYVTTWVSKRGHMLMHLEAKMNRSIRRLRKKYLTF
jgi:macrodomain Ter protein organizer (MatP/YcbG family)